MTVIVSEPFVIVNGFVPSDAFVFGVASIVGSIIYESASTIRLIEVVTLRFAAVTERARTVVAPSIVILSPTFNPCPRCVTVISVDPLTRVNGFAPNVILPRLNI